MFEIVIPLPPVTKKNSGNIMYNSKTGRPFLMPSETYRKYEKACMQYLWKWRHNGTGPIDYPVNVRCTFYMQTRRLVDLTNLLQAIDDVLVKYGVVADDNSRIIAGHDGSRVRYDKNNPRTEITITTLEEEEL